MGVFWEWEYYTATEETFAKFAVPFIRKAMEKQE